MADLAEVPSPTPVNFSIRKWLIGRFGVVAVDIIRFWPIPLVLALVILLVFYVLRSPLDSDAPYIVTYHGILGVICFIAGLACTNDDRERGTLRLLRILPVRAVRLLLQKLAAALVLVILFMVLSEFCHYFAHQMGWGYTGFLNSTLGSYRSVSAWNFGTLYSLSAVQILCMVLVGLAAGTLFKNFVYSAIAGLGVYALWYAGWNWGFRFLEAGNRTDQFHALMIGQQLLLGFIAGVVFIRAVGHGMSLNASQANTEQIEPDRRHNGFRWRVPWEINTTPYSRRLFIITLLTGTAVAIIASLLPPGEFEKFDAHWFLFLIPAAALGVSIFDKDELSSISGLIYWQPVSRATILNRRLIALAAYSALATLPVIFVARFSNPLLLLPLLSLVLGTGLMGALGRLFYRNPVFPLVLISVISCEWGIACAVVYDFQRLPSFNGQQSISLPSDSGYFLWYCVIVVSLPLLALKIAYQKTAVLNVRESTRSWLGFSVLFCVGVTGGILLTALPGELFWLMTNALFPLSGASAGGIQ